MYSRWIKAASLAAAMVFFLGFISLTANPIGLSAQQPRSGANEKRSREADLGGGGTRTSEVAGPRLFEHVGCDAPPLFPKRSRGPTGPGNGRCIPRHGEGNEHPGRLDCREYAGHEHSPRAGRRIRKESRSRNRRWKSGVRTGRERYLPAGQCHSLEGRLRRLPHASDGNPRQDAAIRGSGNSDSCEKVGRWRFCARCHARALHPAQPSGMKNMLVKT